MSVVVLGSYFSEKPHPQFGDPHLEGVCSDGRAKQNDIDYIGKWYNSLLELGIEARVFYDNLPPEFVEKYTTKKIEFLPAPPSEYIYNVWRFFCYREYLRANRFDTVFFTDSSDVTVVQNPEGLVTAYPDVDFFVGKDSIKLCQFPYVNFHKLFGWENYFTFFINQFDWDLINCGVIGGRYDNVMLFLDAFCEVHDKMNSPKTISDMFVTNYLIRHIFSSKKTLIGEPVTSNFKQYEVDRKDVYFIHK